MNAILAIWRRQLGSFLGNPLGYVFILAFVLVAGAFLFIPSSFFARNIADFGPLEDIMPWLLDVLLPAIGMGSWASERELGTEEQMMTLPLTPTQAILGKWLALSSFFTLALVCSLSNVAVLMWLGDPDLGLLLANFIGWWIAGLVFSAITVMASALVRLPSLAFVLAALFSAALMSLEQYVNWFDTFNRGLFSLGRIGIGAVFIFLFLGLAVIVVSGHRWQPKMYETAFPRMIFFGSLVIIFFNLSVQADRSAIDWDSTSEGLSSLSQTSVDVLEKLKQPVIVTAFLNKEMPPELALKGLEVENILTLLDRQVGDQLKVKIYRPSDPLDEAGSLATQHFGLTPRPVTVDSVTGREDVQVFLAVVVTCGSRVQKIEYFSPGLSVEYELVRAIRTVSTPTRKVIGVVDTEMKILGSFNYQTMQNRPDWQVVEEWRKQYDVREVILDVPVSDDVNILIAPQPSGLSEAQMKHLHDYIWDGRPTLILEDPMPMFTGPQFASSLPRQQDRPVPGQQPEVKPPKGNLEPLLSGLGVAMDPKTIGWSDFNPSHEFRNIWPSSLLWSFKSKGGINSTPLTTGIDSLLLPWPGTIRELDDENSAIVVEPVVAPIKDSPWGESKFEEHIRQSFMGMQIVEPNQYVTGEGSPPYLAVQITGHMDRIYASKKIRSGCSQPQTG